MIDAAPHSQVRRVGTAGNATLFHAQRHPSKHPGRQAHRQTRDISKSTHSSNTEADHDHHQQGHYSSADIAGPTPLAPIVPLPVRVPLPPTLARPVSSRHDCTFENLTGAVVLSTAYAQQAHARCKVGTLSETSPCSATSGAMHLLCSAKVPSLAPDSWLHPHLLNKLPPNSTCTLVIMSHCTP